MAQVQEVHVACVGGIVGEQGTDAFAHQGGRHGGHFSRYGAHIAAILFLGCAAGKELLPGGGRQTFFRWNSQRKHLYLFPMHGSAHQWNTQFGTRAFDHSSGMQVVRTIGYHGMPLKQMNGILGIKEAGMRQQMDAIGQTNRALQGHTHFQRTDIRWTVQRLPRKIGRFHGIAIDQGYAFHGQTVK